MSYKSVFVIVCAFSFLNANGQYKEHAFKLTTLNYNEIGSVGLSYERMLKLNQSLQFGFLYTNYSGGGERAQGPGISQEYRFYSRKSNRLNGFYIGPFLHFQNLNVLNNSGSWNINLLRGGAVIGKQWVVKDKLTIDLFVGPSFQKVFMSSHQDGHFNYDTYIKNQPSMRAGISIGILKARSSCCN